MSKATVPPGSTRSSRAPASTAMSISIVSPARRSAPSGTRLTRAAAASWCTRTGRNSDAAGSEVVIAVSTRHRPPCGSAVTLIRVRPTRSVLVSMDVARHRTGSRGTKVPARWLPRVAATHPMSDFDAGAVGTRQADHRPRRHGQRSTSSIIRWHVDADVRRQVGIVDHEEIRAFDPRPALACDVAATGDVEDEDMCVDEGGREGRGEIVAPRFHQNRVQPECTPPSSSSMVRRLAPVSSRIAVCGQAPVSTARIRSAREHPGRPQETGVLVGVDVVGDDRPARASTSSRHGSRSRSSSRCRPGRRRRGERARSGWA